MIIYEHKEIARKGDRAVYIRYARRPGHPTAWVEGYEMREGNSVRHAWRTVTDQMIDGWIAGGI